MDTSKSSYQQHPFQYEHGPSQTAHEKFSSATTVKRKSLSWKAFHELNGDCHPVVGHKYRVARSEGTVEDWVLMHIDQANHMLLFMSV